MNQKSILLTQDKRLEQYIKVLMTVKKKKLESDLPLLFDISALKKDIQQYGNTLHLRGEFGSFVRKCGLPYMTIMDYMIDFGLPESTDPDRRKLLRTFLIAFTILANGKGYDTTTANIVLIIDKKSLGVVSQFTKEPAIILKQVQTQDPRVNAIIESFAHNRERVNSFYDISYIFKPEGGDYNSEMRHLEKIIDEADTRLRKKEMAKEKATSSSMITDDMTPADVICRATTARMIINGEIKEPSDDEGKRYHIKNINLIGAITAKTIKTVNERILQTFKAMSKTNPFKKDERIFINIPDTSLIDGSFCSSLGSLLNGDLSSYTGISLNMGKNNCTKVRESDGFIAIKDYLIKNL